MLFPRLRKSARVMEFSDLRFWNADFRFKSFRPTGEECIHLNLQSPIINHTCSSVLEQVAIFTLEAIEL
jgi:hypothetical protein